LNRGVTAIDEVLPRFDASEVHSIAFPLNPSEAIGAALATPVGADPLVRALFRARGIHASGTIGESLQRLGLREIARTEGEVVFGGAGTPWRPGTRIAPFASAGPGQVRVVTSFHADGRLLTTETRIAAVDDAARRAFTWYWRIVGPFSALIRRRWLRAIANTQA
jgi:hypothetical protein